MADDVRNTPRQMQPRSETEPARIASPRARRVAKEMGIDWRRVDGTGRDGRVRESDVLQASRQKTVSDAFAVPLR